MEWFYKPLRTTPLITIKEATMMYRYIILCIISFCVSSFSVLAQLSESPAHPELPDGALELLHQLNQHSNSHGSYAITQQVGEANIAQISLQHVREDQDVVAIGQYGANNRSDVSNEGAQHWIAVFQVGDQNEAIVSSQGSNVYSFVAQMGQGNYVNEDIENIDASPKTVSTVQYGNGNSIELKTAQDYVNIDVVQSGTGNFAELDFTDMGGQTEPYKVEQFDGGKVSISHSAFFMPMKEIRIP
jgi:hypothetical protein